LQTILRPLLLSLVLFACATACVKLPRRVAPSGDKVSKTQATNHSAPPVSINRASREELERLPGVGPVLAARIIEHRERRGPFRKVEHLLIVRGMSDRRFRELRALITAE
jgi:competence protein ComEA